MEALKTGSAFRDPARPARKKAAGRKGNVTPCLVISSCTIEENLFVCVNHNFELHPWRSDRSSGSKEGHCSIDEIQSDRI